MKKKELENLVNRLENALRASQEECYHLQELLKESLEKADKKLTALTTEKQQLEKHYQTLEEQYKNKTRDFNCYKELANPLSLNTAFKITLKTIQSHKEKYLCLFSKMQREYLLSLVESSQKEDQKQMLEQIENIFASL